MVYAATWKLNVWAPSQRVQDRKGEIHEADRRDESMSPDGAVINRSFIAAIQSPWRNCVGDMKFDEISKWER